MNIIELSNVVRKENHIYYRREYTANVHCEVMTQIRVVPVEFSIEHTPVGDTDIQAKVVGSSELPIIPFVAKLKSYVLEIDKKGDLL